MAWSTPLTAVANAAFTAAQFNASVRDNLLETAPAKATTAGSYFVATGANAVAQRTAGTDVVTTNETTASTAYADLATTGPLFSVTTGTLALVFFGCYVSNNTIGSRAIMSFRVSGASTVAAADASSLSYEPYASNKYVGCSRVILQTGLTPGSSQFRCQYRVISGTGAYEQRSLSVFPY